MTRKIDPALIPKKPHLEFETALWRSGCLYVGGVDEAGRGCLAGPVIAAMVILSQGGEIQSEFSGVLDSKQLNPQQRDKQRIKIISKCLAWAVGSASNVEIDQLGIVPATRLAVHRAQKMLDIIPDHLLVDYIVLPNNPLPQTRLVKGDARSLSIAAASILAKTHRDALMIRESENFPQFGFEKNMGYGTAYHRQAIQDFGPTSLHRLSFAPLKDLSATLQS